MDTDRLHSNFNSSQIQFKNWIFSRHTSFSAYVQVFGCVGCVGCVGVLAVLAALAVLAVIAVFCQSVYFMLMLCTFIF